MDIYYKGISLCSIVVLFQAMQVQRSKKQGSEKSSVRSVLIWVKFARTLIDLYVV